MQLVICMHFNSGLIITEMRYGFRRKSSLINVEIKTSFLSYARVYLVVTQKDCIFIVSMNGNDCNDKLDCV